ncbi:MAG: hypothetical protein IRZ09_03360 [Variibacter sp.]|nr:hypothetical protein [Variibacter sp.]
MSEARQTTDHDVIQRWAEERNGYPATVAGTAGENEGAGLLRIDFDPPDERLQRTSWSAFFSKLDRENLVFLYQERTADGQMSRFHKFIDKETARRSGR